MTMAQSLSSGGGGDQPADRHPGLAGPSPTGGPALKHTINPVRAGLENIHPANGFENWREARRFIQPRIEPEHVLPDGIRRLSASVRVNALAQAVRSATVLFRAALPRWAIDSGFHHELEVGIQVIAL